jgi:hypothetical protein
VRLVLATEIVAANSHRFRPACIRDRPWLCHEQKQGIFFFVNYREMSNGKMIFYRMVWFLKGPRVRRDTQIDTRRFSGAWIGLVRSGRCGPSSFFHVERLQLQLERARRDFLLAL